VIVGFVIVARAFGGVWAFGIWQMPKVLVEFYLQLKPPEQVHTIGGVFNSATLIVLTVPT